MDKQNLQGQQRTDQNCSLCPNPSDNDMITCIKCNNLFHKGCINIADNIPYRCKQCTTIRTTSPARSSSSHRSNDSNQSQSRRIKLQLKRLEEQHRLEREFVNKNTNFLKKRKKLTTHLLRPSPSEIG